jgi:hypothetical protein
MGATMLALATTLLALTGIGFLTAGLLPLTLGVRRGEATVDGIVVGLGVLFVLLDLVAVAVGGTLLWAWGV